jgi:hypothetical protein
MITITFFCFFFKKRRSWRSQQNDRLHYSTNFHAQSPLSQIPLVTCYQSVSVATGGGSRPASEFHGPRTERPTWDSRQVAARRTSRFTNARVRRRRAALGRRGRSSRLTWIAPWGADANQTPRRLARLSSSRRAPSLSLHNSTETGAPTCQWNHVLRPLKQLPFDR